MNISLNLTDALIIGLIVVTIILVIYLIVLAARLKETLQFIADWKGGQCGHRSGSHSVSSSEKAFPEGRSGIQPRKCSEVPEKIDSTGHCSNTNKQYCKYYFYK